MFESKKGDLYKVWLILKKNLEICLQGVLLMRPRRQDKHTSIEPKCNYYLFSCMWHNAMASFKNLSWLILRCSFKSVSIILRLRLYYYLVCGTAPRTPSSSSLWMQHTKYAKYKLKKHKMWMRHCFHVPSQTLRPLCCLCQQLPLLLSLWAHRISRSVRLNNTRLESTKAEEHINYRGVWKRTLGTKSQQPPRTIVSTAKGLGNSCSLLTITPTCTSCLLSKPLNHWISVAFWLAFTISFIKGKALTWVDIITILTHVDQQGRTMTSEQEHHQHCQVRTPSTRDWPNWTLQKI